ncbi:MAG: caspase family protein [Xanthobacteraceae bacterium]
MRLVLSFLTVLLSVAVAGPVAAQQAARQQVALLIGNAKYPDAEAPLKEPVNDVRALAEELRRGGFDVEIGENLTREAMQQALTRLYGKVNPSSVALIYFSGYGIQSNRQTYIVPVDAQIWAEADVKRDGVSLDTALAEMNTRGASVKIAVLDASRRNPYERRFRSVSAGLAPVAAPPGSLVMYSAAPSAVVGDSTSDRGMFSDELIKQIRTAGLSGEEAFNRTRLAVSRVTRGEQVPWFSSTSTEDFSFNGKGGTAVAVAPAAPAPAAPTPVAPAPVAPAPVAKPAAPAPVAPAPVAKPAPPAAPAPASTAKLEAPAPVAPAAPAPAVVAKAVDDAAIKELDKRIAQNPKDAAAYYTRGQELAKGGDYARAVRDFDEVIMLNPKDADAFNNRCWAHAILGDLQAALKDCNESLQIRPRSVDALDSRGLVNLKLNLTANAIADYDAVLAIDAKQASSLYGRGIAKLRNGNKAASDSDIAAAKAINPKIAEEFVSYGVR